MIPVLSSRNQEDSMRSLTRLFALACIVLALTTFSPVLVSAQTRAALVKNVDEPGLVPFSQSFTITQNECCCTNCCFLNTAAVPAGKRLVITNISGNLPLAAVANFGPVNLSVGSTRVATLPVAFRMQWNGGDYPAYEFNEKIDAYVEAGNTAQLLVFHSSSWNFREGSVTING
jgi:hypothetical protein